VRETCAFARCALSRSRVWWGRFFSLGMVLSLKKKKRERAPAVEAQILTRPMIAEGLR
jgi:hypothetical protein